MTCKDCINYNICGEEKPYGNSIRTVCKANGWKLFKDKSKIIELPCIAMVEQSLKNGKFDRTHTSYNGKIAVVYIHKTKMNIPLIDITSRYYNTCEAYDRVNQLNEEAELALRERELK